MLRVPPEEPRGMGTTFPPNCRLVPECADPHFIAVLCTVSPFPSALQCQNTSRLRVPAWVCSRCLGVQQQVSSCQSPGMSGCRDPSCLHLQRFVGGTALGMSCTNRAPANGCKRLRKFRSFCTRPVFPCCHVRDRPDRVSLSQRCLLLLMVLWCPKHTYFTDDMQYKAIVIHSLLLITS